MPIGTYTMLKPKTGEPFFAETTTGAHYYVFGPDKAVATYKKASALIILPNNIRLKGTGNGRNAYISFGVATSAHGIDIGICNKGLNGGGDKGSGWHPYYLDNNNKSVGRYFTDNTAPEGTVKARIEVEPRTDGRTIHLTVTWLDSNGKDLGNGLNQEIEMIKAYQWTNFFRFVSLVPHPETTETNDSTYILGGAFTNLKLGDADWGIPTARVSRAWIMHHPKCQVENYGNTSEQFKIDHWA